MCRDDDRCKNVGNSYLDFVTRQNIAPLQTFCKQYPLTDVSFGNRQSRKMLFRSWKGLLYDDWIMGIFVTATYTVMVVMSNKWLKYKSNLERPGFDFSALPTHEISQRRLGSIFMIVTEQMQITVIWSCKATLLIMYHRLTRAALRNENVAIKVLSAYTALGFIVVEILYFAAWCRPFSAYYAVPTTSSQCNTLIDHRITKAVFNISSDVIMLLIALQMLIRSLLPIKRKIILLGIFSLGIFVIAASIINSYTSFSKPYGSTWMYWYVRESSTAILVANLPFTWTILRDVFALGDFNENSPPPPWTYHSPRTAPGRKTAQYLQRNGRTEPRSVVHHSPLNSNAMTLVGSVSPVKNGGACPAVSPQAEDQEERADDGSSIRDAACAQAGCADADIANGEAAPGLLDPPHNWPMSHCHDQDRKDLTSRPPTVMEDGTGGFFVNQRKISPRPQAHMNPSGNWSREPSLSSNRSKQLRPASNQAGILDDSQDKSSFMSSTPETISGGRSARDRKVRAQLSA